MVRTVPTGVIVLCVIAFVSSVLLTWLLRDRHKSRGAVRVFAILEDLILITLMLIMTAATIIQVLVRFLLSDLFVVAWTEELALLCMVWLAFFSAAVVAREYGHIAFDMITGAVPARARRVMLICGESITICVLMPIAWFGFQDARFLDILMTVSLGLPLAAFGYVVPVIVPLTIVFSAIHLVMHLRGQDVEAQKPEFSE